MEGSEGSISKESLDSNIDSSKRLLATRAVGDHCKAILKGYCKITVWIILIDWFEQSFSWMWLRLGRNDVE